MADTIVVAIYQHQYWDSVRAFRSIESAYKWRDDIADHAWDNSFPGDPKPAQDIGIEYFKKIIACNGGREWFEIRELHLED